MSITRENVTFYSQAVQTEQGVVNNQENTVLNVHWRRCAQLGELIGKKYYNTPVDVSVGEFIPFDELTAEDILSWIDVDPKHDDDAFAELVNIVPEETVEENQVATTGTKVWV